MIDTNKIIGFYTDVFGNEIDIYEQTEKYSICYTGIIFYGDSDGYNEHGYDRWEDVISIYYAYPNITIRDNEYGTTFHDGEWN